MNDGRVKALGVRYYGELAAGRTDMIVNAVLVGLFKPMLSTRRHAGERPNRRARARHRSHRVAQHALAQLHEPALGEAAHAATASAGSKARCSSATSPRLVLLDGIGVEAPLEGTMIVICNTDQPGVIGEIGTILGKHGVNIANFALGRDEATAPSAS